MSKQERRQIAALKRENEKLRSTLTVIEAVTAHAAGELEETDSSRGGDPVRQVSAVGRR